MNTRYTMTWLIDYHNVFTFNLGLQQYDQFRRFSFIFVSFNLSPFVILYKYQGIKCTFQGQQNIYEHVTFSNFP